MFKFQTYTKEGCRSFKTINRALPHVKLLEKYMSIPGLSVGLDHFCLYQHVERDGNVFCYPKIKH